MKKVLAMMVAVCAMSMTTVVYAQEQCPDMKKGDCKEMRARHDAMMKKELNLSDEQMAQMRAANEELEAAMKANHENMKSAKSKHDVAIEKVLTPEQKAKYDEMKKNHPGKKEFRRNGRPMHREGARMDGKECRRPDLKCDSMPGKHHRKGHKHHGQCPTDLKCDSMPLRSTHGVCPEMKGCDKKQDCPKMKGECSKEKACDKKCADCPKMKGECQKGKACEKQNGECAKAQNCDKKKECSKK